MKKTVGHVTTLAPGELKKYENELRDRQISDNVAMSYKIAKLSLQLWINFLGGSNDI